MDWSASHQVHLGVSPQNYCMQLTSMLVLTRELLPVIVSIAFLLWLLHARRHGRIRESSAISALLAIYFLSNLCSSAVGVCLYSPCFLVFNTSTAESAAVIAVSASDMVADIALFGFVNTKLLTCYKNTFLSVSTRAMNACLLVKVVSNLCYFAAYILVAAFQQSQPQLLQSQNVQYGTVSQLYCLLVLLLFNRKLYQFIAFTQRNNAKLSSEVNRVVLHLVTKETYLVSLIAAVLFVITVVYYLFMFALIPYSGYWLTLDWCANLLHHLTLPICMYLSFRRNDQQYQYLCSCCHARCVACCSKLVSRSSAAHVHTNGDQHKELKRIVTGYGNRDGAQCDGDCTQQAEKCAAVKRMIDVLSTEIVSEPQLQSAQITALLNDFYHLLSYHDNAEDFERIFQQLPLCDIEQCVQCLRNYRKRACVNVLKENKEDDEREENKKAANDEQHVFADIVDKLHVFYLHSYELRSRRRPNEEMPKSAIERRESVTRIGGTSKFQSDLTLNAYEQYKTAEVGNDDVYSFGYRFEYVDQMGSMYVAPKYEDLKTELINNALTNIGLLDYQKQCEKAAQFINTNHVKSLTHSNAQKICIQHILALLVYCNCDQYQTKWSTTFRKLTVNESDEALKERHSHFVHISISVIELVEQFGQRLIYQQKRKRSFYHGVNQILHFDRTITQFNGPLSTSEEFFVAHNFSAGQGLVLELKYSFSQFPLKAKYFPCAFFSDYPNEKECLFIGGLPILIMTNIINVSDGTEYKDYINGLNVINSVFNGTYSARSVNAEDSGALNACIQILADNANDDIPVYIQQLVQNYRRNLQHIVILWDTVFGANNERNVHLQNVLNIQCWFFDLNTLLHFFPNLEQIEYFNQYVSKTSIEQITHELAQNVHGNELKYVVIHLANNTLASSSSSIIPASVFSASTLQWKQPLLVNSSAQSPFTNQWEAAPDKSKIVLFRGKERRNVAAIKYYFNEIKQGYTTSNILRNLNMNVLL